MSEMQNTLKEVDIQVVYRRLEARKRNITRKGQMSKRQLATAYRGYHGLETQYHAMQQMSSDTMINTKHKNDHIQTKHVEDMKHLIEMEKTVKGRAEKDLKAMRDDFTAQLAYQYVYKSHSFKRFYKAQQEKKPRPVSDKPEFYDLERRNSAKLSGPRPLGSLRQVELYKDELKVKFPQIVQADNTDEFNSPRVNMMGEKTFRERDNENRDHHQLQDLTSFPNIENAMGIEVKFQYKPPKDDDRFSAVTAPPAGIEGENEEIPTDFQNNLITFDMGRNLMLMRLKEKERIGGDKRRELPQTPSGNHGRPIDDRKESWRRILPETPNRPSTVFQGSRNPIDMKKLMRKEASDLMRTWDNASVHKNFAEKAKEHYKAHLEENPVPLFDRSRPTSAILRDYREYKKHQAEELAKREEAENDQTMIVRQISPQPRATSPVAEMRNKYMHAGKPGPSRDGSPVHAGPLRRTESDKFSSVSRTTSYKDIPDKDSLNLENAMLTAAERIELEKEKRNNKSKAASGAKDGTIPKVKRRLPPTPASQKKKQDIQGGGKQHKSEDTNMFNTSILAKNRDIDMINRVQLANVTINDDKELPDLKHPIPNSERNQYTPIIKHQDSSSINTGPSPFPRDSITRIKTASALYGKDLWPTLSRKMKFDYENFTRTPPDTKKRLETRIKNRKKIQQKNAQLAEELKKGKTKIGKSKEESDRPPTRVSFNENVIVFQTI